MVGGTAGQLSVPLAIPVPVGSPVTLNASKIRFWLAPVLRLANPMMDTGVPDALRFPEPLRV
jgi:hypothetical protein